MEVNKDLFVEYLKSENRLSKPKHFVSPKYTKEGFKKGIVEVEKRLKEIGTTFTEKEKDFFNPLKHKFANGIYVREVFTPAGQLLITEIHKKDNAYFVMKGEITIMSEDGEVTIEAPYYGITKAGTKRIIYVHKDCIFVTVHSTNTKSVKDAEEELIAKNFKDIEV